MFQPINDVRIELKARNNLILRAMEEKGIPGIRALAEAIKKPKAVAVLYDLVGMKIPARTKSGEWREVVLTLADFFQCMPEDLFSDSQQHTALEKNRAHAELTYAQTRELGALRKEGVSPEQLAQAKQVRLLIGIMLHKLAPREQRVLRLRYGFVDGREHVLEEIAADLSVTRERVRQIEIRALSKLKWSQGGRAVRKAAGVAEGESEDFQCLDLDVMDAL